MEGIVNTCTSQGVVQDYSDPLGQGDFSFAPPTAPEGIDSPTVDKNTFKQIFRDHWDAFKVRYPRFDRPHYSTVVQRMLDCGDPERMGYVQYRCLRCGETRRIGFTCKSCFCLSCAQPRMSQWADFIGRRLFPGVTYRHFVLTTPDFVRHWFYQNAELFGQLMRTGYACLKDIFQTTTGTPLDIGCAMVLQTFGRSGEFNPHLHILVTAGGLSPQRTWKAVNFIPYDLMHRKWQYHLLGLLRQHVDDPRVEEDIDRGWKATTASRCATGTKTTKRKPLSTSRCRCCVSSAGWCSIFCPKDFNAFATLDCTATPATKRTASNWPRCFPLQRRVIRAATASFPDLSSANSFWTRLARSLCSVLVVAHRWTGNCCIIRTMAY